MSPRLVFVHGRAQEHKDPAALKAEWLGALAAGLAKSGLTLPVAADEVGFPYYGDRLHGLAQATPAAGPVGVQYRGGFGDGDEYEFTRQVLEEIRRGAGIDDASVQAELETDGFAIQRAWPRGLQDSSWLRAMLRVLDRRVPGMSGATIALLTHDVYEYLHRPGVRDAIDAIVRAALPRDRPAVVVAHSLGTVVGYALLAREGDALGWQVPQFVTLGSPLALTAIKRGLAPIRHPPCAGDWFNALDPRDIVSLYPLDADHFPIDPAITNRSAVDNDTDNRHGIAGYLSDPEVARRIHAALLAR